MPKDSSPRPHIVPVLLARGLTYGLGTVVNAGAALLLIPFYILHLTPAEYGRYALADMLAIVLALLVAFGLNVSLLARFPAGDPPRQRRMIGSALLVALVSVACWEVLFFALRGITQRRLLHELGPEVLLLAGAVAGIEGLWIVVSGVFRAEGRARRFLLFTMSQMVLTIASTVILVLTAGLKEHALLYGRLIGASAVLVPALALELKKGISFDRGEARGLARDGGPLVLAALASMLVALWPRYLINDWGSTADVGIFAMTFRMASVINVVLVQPFGLAWIPILREIPKDREGRRICGRVVTTYLVAGTVAALGCLLLSPLIAAWARHGQYRFDEQLLALLCAANVVAGLMHAVNVGPYVESRPAIQVPVFLVVAAVAVPLAWLGLELWGLRGVGLALLATYSLQAALLYGISQRIFPTEIPYGRTVLHLAGVTAAFLAARTVGGMLAGPLGLAIQVAMFGVITAIVLRQTRFLGDLRGSLRVPAQRGTHAVG